MSPAPARRIRFVHPTWSSMLTGARLLRERGRRPSRGGAGSMGWRRAAARALGAASRVVMDRENGRA